MRFKGTKVAALGCLSALAVVALVFTISSLTAHGQSLALANAPREDDPWQQAIPARAGGEAPSRHNEGAREALSLDGLQAAEVQVSIQPTQSVVALGESFTVAVAIEDAPEIVGYDFKMDWDATVFSVTAVADVALSDVKTPAQFSRIYNEEGTLTFAAFLVPSTEPPPYPPNLPSGDGDLAVVTLQAKSVGTSTLDLYDTRVFTRSGGQIRVADPGDGTAESTCEAAEIVDLEADSPVELGQTTGFTATVNGAQPITYTWDFNSDGSAEQIGVGLDTVTYAYAATGTYTAALTVNNVCGVEDAETVTVVVVEGACQAVQIAALVSDPSLTAGVPAHFTATVSGAQPITYSWDFDSDGAPERVGAGLDVVTHTYPAAGTYTATLTVENGCPSQATETLSVTVEEACEEVTITNLTAGSPVKIGAAMGFTATVTGSAPYTYTWDFGDGGAGQGTGLDTATPSWTYTGTGSYTVTLTIDNPCGTDQDSEVVTVESYTLFLPLIVKEYP